VPGYSDQFEKAEAGVARDDGHSLPEPFRCVHDGQEAAAVDERDTRQVEDRNASVRAVGGVQALQQQRGRGDVQFTDHGDADGLAVLLEGYMESSAGIGLVVMPAFDGCQEPISETIAPPGTTRPGLVRSGLQVASAGTWHVWEERLLEASPPAVYPGNPHLERASPLKVDGHPTAPCRTPSAGAASARRSVGCGDPVQADARVWVEREDGELQSRVSLRNLPEGQRDHVRRIWHIGCLRPNAA
jgi:hypothetical protein